MVFVSVNFWDFFSIQRRLRTENTDNTCKKKTDRNLRLVLSHLYNHATFEFKTRVILACAMCNPQWRRQPAVRTDLLAQSSCASARKSINFWVIKRIYRSFFRLKFLWLLPIIALLRFGNRIFTFCLLFMENIFCTSKMCSE